MLARAAYQAVFAHGRKLSDPYFLLIVEPRHDGEPRLGMAVSRRHARTAVERNRIKRLVRETFRQRRRELPPLDIVVMLRRDTAGTSRATLGSGLDRLWHLLIERERA